MNTTTEKTENKIGSWQEFFERTCSDRVKKAIERTVCTPQICLEHARAELAVAKETEGMDIPRVLKRAMIFKKYLEERTIFISEGELIVGNVNSKVRGSTIVADLHAGMLDRELGDPVMDYEARPYDPHIILEDERRELRESIIPYFKDHTLEQLIYSKCQGEVREKGFIGTAKCKHIPNYADLMVTVDAGHLLGNYEKVLKIGLRGIRKEAESYYIRSQAEYSHFQKKKKADFYQAVLMVLDAAIEHAKRYEALAAAMAEEEEDPVRRRELQQISEVMGRVPAGPAESWQEALQSVWFIQMLILCEQVNYGNSFGRFDCYMYPYFQQSVEIDRSITRDQALEMLELFFVKASTVTELYDYIGALVQIGFPVSQNMIIGGQTQQGTDACNEVTMLALEAEEQVGLIQPELAFRIWEGTPDRYLRKAAEVVRLGRGKPKFYGDRTALKMVRTAYPYLTDEELRDYAVIGCIEIAMPGISNEFSCTGISNVAKILDLTLHNGRCSVCGEELGPKTGEPQSFKTMDEFKRAFREQIFYSTQILMKSVKCEMECQAMWNHSPFCSALLEGPLEKGVDLIEGGALDSSFGVMCAGAANTGDSLTVIDRLIYREKKISWEQLMEAIDHDWEGYEPLRQMAINGAPKYGNDNDEADANVSYVLNTWYDSIDWANTNRDMFPFYGGRFKGLIALGNSGCTLGQGIGALPDGFKAGSPLADALSPVQGRDVCGTTAVLKSISKMPAHRFEEGTLLNQRLSPMLLATDEDLDNFVSYLRTAEQLGLFHIQFNIVDSAILRAALKQPEKYKDLLVRVASYTSYYVELDPRTQQDIINRTEQQAW